jgi:nucleoside-diphosphate-sugar epimerase
VPVVVTGASGGVGRVLVPMLAARGEVRAVVRSRSASDALRESGAKVAICDLEDTNTLATVMGGAHTVCHLAGGLDLPDDQAYTAVNQATTVSTLEAAVEAGVRRALFLSYPGASPSATNAYLRTKGLAEEAVRSSGLEHVILRCTHVYGPGQRWLVEMRAAATRPLAAIVVGPGSQRLAPVFVEDLARALLTADDRASRVDGTFGLQGPDQVSADEMVDLLAGRRRRKVHLGPEAARRAARVQRRHLSPTMLEILATDSLADAPDAAKEFGLRMTPLRDGLKRSLMP